MIARRALILILIILLFAALACKGDPGGWTPTEASPGGDVAATLTPAAAEFNAWATAVSETSVP